MTTTPPDRGTTPPPQAPPWRFVRRERGRMIAGVATGMADAFHIDVVVIRVLWVIAALAGGLGVAAYVICWLAFPSDRARGAVVAHQLPRAGRTVAQRGRHRRHRADRPRTREHLRCADATLPPRRRARLGDPADRRWRRHPPVPAPTTATVRARRSGPPAPRLRRAPHHRSRRRRPRPRTPNRRRRPSPRGRRPRARGPNTRRGRRSRRDRRGSGVRGRRPFLTPLTVSLLLIGGGIAALLDSAGWVHLTAAGVLASGLIARRVRARRLGVARTRARTDPDRRPPAPRDDPGSDDRRPDQRRHRRAHLPADDTRGAAAHIHARHRAPR